MAPVASRFGLARYISSRLMVPLSRQCACSFSRSGFVEALLEERKRERAKKKKKKEKKRKKQGYEYVILIIGSTVPHESHANDRRLVQVTQTTERITSVNAKPKTIQRGECCSDNDEHETTVCRLTVLDRPLRRRPQQDGAQQPIGAAVAKRRPAGNHGSPRVHPPHATSTNFQAHPLLTPLCHGRCGACDFEAIC